MSNVKDVIEARIKSLRANVEKMNSFKECLAEMDKLDEQRMITSLVQSIESSIALMFEYEEVDEDAELSGFVAECDDKMNCAEFYWGDGEDEFFEAGPVRGGFKDPGYGVILSKAKTLVEAEDPDGLVIDFMWSSLARVFNLAMEKVVLSKKFKKLPRFESFCVYLCQHDGWGSGMSEEGLVFKI